MRVGLGQGIRTLPSRPAPITQSYQDFLELGVMAEQLGFAHVWLSEHHFAADDWNPSPIVALAALAARTSSIRLGTYVTLVAMHNPLRLAEDTATLDIISNGRFDLGYGARGFAVEHKTFGLDPKSSFGRTYEALEIMERCWTEDEFSHHGKYYTFENVRMRPKPVQRPIPIYSASTGPQSLAKVAERGYNLASGILTPLWKDYDEQLEAHGRSRKDVDVVSGPIYWYVSDSKEKAWDECEEAMQWGIAFYEGHVAEGETSRMKAPPLGEFRKQGMAYGMPVAVGSPDDVLKTLSAYKDEPLDEIVLYSGWPGVPQHLAKRSLDLFARECMPEVARWGGAR